MCVYSKPQKHVDYQLMLSSNLQLLFRSDCNISDKVGEGDGYVTRVSGFSSECFKDYNQWQLLPDRLN